MRFFFLDLIFVLKKNTCIIFSAWSLAYCNRFQFVIRQNLSVLFQLYKSDFWKFDITIFNGYISIYTVCCITFAVGFLGFKFWKTNFSTSKKNYCMLSANSFERLPKQGCPLLSTIQILIYIEPVCCLTFLSFLDNI